MKNIFIWIKTHIFLFGVISNIIPIIGLFVLEGVDFQGLHAYQFWAWIAGGIYYVFVWGVSIAAYRKIKKDQKSLEARITDLEEAVKQLKEKK